MRFASRVVLTRDSLPERRIDLRSAKVSTLRAQQRPPTSAGVVREAQACAGARAQRRIDSRHGVPSSPTRTKSLTARTPAPTVCNEHVCAHAISRAEIDLAFEGSSEKDTPLVSGSTFTSRTGATRWSEQSKPAAVPMSMTKAAVFTYSSFLHTVVMRGVQYRLLRRLPLELPFA